MHKWFLLFLMLGLSGLGMAIMLAQEPAVAAADCGEAGPLPQSPFAITADIPLTTPLLFEGFETGWPPPGWFLDWYTYGGELGYRWTYTFTTYHSGSHSAYHVYPRMEVDTWLVTAQVTPTADSELTFWQSEKYANRSISATHSIWVSTRRQDPKYDDFVHLTDVPPAEEAEEGEPPIWEPFSVDLSAHAGQPIYLAFRYEGAQADEWYVDDVEVTTGLYVVSDSPTPLGQATTFTASVAPGRDAAFAWDFGDEDPLGSGAVVTHTYAEAGDYTVVVTATNAGGAVITGTTTVSVGGFVYLPLVVRD
jgi:hypothetical protein